MNHSPTPLPPDHGRIHFRTGAAAGVRTAVDGCDARNGGSVSVPEPKPVPEPERVPFSGPCQKSSTSDNLRPQYYIQHRQQRSLYYRQTSHLQTTTQQQPHQHQLPKRVSHKPVAPVVHSVAHDNNTHNAAAAASSLLSSRPRRYIPSPPANPALRGGGEEEVDVGGPSRSAANTDHLKAPAPRRPNPPSRFEIDPPTTTTATTISSLTSAATESEDLSRLQKLRAAAQPLFAKEKQQQPPDPIDSIVSDLTGNCLRNVAPPKPSLFSSSSSAAAKMMIRKRIATGEEVILAPNSPDPPMSPDRPDSGRIEGFREFASRPKNEMPARAPIDDSARLERERLAREREAREREEAERLKKEKAARGKAWNFGWKKMKENEWPASPGGEAGEKPAAEAAATPSPRRSGGAAAAAAGSKTILNRRTSSLSLKTNGKDGDPLSQKRVVNERSSAVRTPPAVNRERPASAASLERRRSIVSNTSSPGDRVSKHSRIPSSVSPAVSRPTSSHERRSIFSTISSTSERRPLRSTPSSASLASRTSGASSPGIPRTSHSRSESHPNPSTATTAEKRATSTKTSQADARRSAAAAAAAAAAPASSKRSESAPSNNYSIAMPPAGPSSTGSRSRTPSLKTEKSSESEGKASSSVASKIDDNNTSPTRKRRGDSIDSFLGGTHPDQLDQSKDHTPQASATTTTNNNNTTKDKPAAVRSPSLTDYINYMQEKGNNESVYGSAPSSGSPLYDRSTGLPKEFPKPKSALQDDEEEESSMDILDQLNKKDQEYAQILSQPKGEDEDDTFLLLGGSERYEPLPGQRVRPKAEALAGDRTRQKEKTAHEQLLIRLKTLHMELRSARQGIDYIERRLNGVGSSDESEWVDDEDDPDGSIISKRPRLPRGEKMKRSDTTNTAVSTADTAVSTADDFSSTRAPPSVVAEDLAPPPVPVHVIPEPSTAVKIGVIVAQLILIWFALEVYFFYISFPPSYSQYPVYTTTVPSFGNQVFKLAAAAFVRACRTLFSTPALLCAVLAAIVGVAWKLFWVRGAAGGFGTAGKSSLASSRGEYVIR